MLHDLRTAPTDTTRVDDDQQLKGDLSHPQAAYGLATKTDGPARAGGTRLFALFDQRDRYIFFASAAMMLLPLLGGYYFNR